MLICCAFPLFADVSAVGYGASEDEARSNAASELSFVIYSDVRAKLNTYATDAAESPVQTVTKEVNVTSSIPLMGATYNTVNSDGEYMTTAYLTSKDALPVYVKASEEAVRAVNSSYKEYEKAKDDSARYAAVMSAIAGYENFIRLRAVFNILGGVADISPVVTYEHLEQLKGGLTEVSDSMKHTAAMIVSELKSGNAYVYYPTYIDSQEVTEFGSLFRDMLVSAEGGSGSLRDSDKYISTEYFLSGDVMHITSSLMSRDGVTLGKSVKMLRKRAFEGMRFKPESVSFEKLLVMGQTESANFTARMSTANGKKAMLYKEGESVELFVKLNRPGYFFIVGHVDKAGEKYSYLVDFYSADGNRKFVRRVDGDSVNRWLSLGEFDIVPPFGLETFQLIATVKDPVDSLPANVFDPETELYIVSKDINTGVAKSRALKRKPENLNAVAEDVLIFSTIEK